MRMSTKGRYGLRLMMELAKSYGGGPVLGDVIAKNQSISRAYIHLLANGLKASGLLRTVRGPRGGYELARAPSSITALDVVSVLEGRSAPVDCVLSAGLCPRGDHCAARDVWCDVASAMDAALAGFTLADLATRQRLKAAKAAKVKRPRSHHA